jgi:hypothetical protein
MAEDFKQALDLRCSVFDVWSQGKLKTLANKILSETG